MKTFWDANVRQGLLARLEHLQPDSQRRWGKMTCEQMLRHLNNAAQMVTGELPVKPMSSPLRLWPLNKAIIYWLPWPHGAPAAPELIAHNTAAWEREKEQLIVLTEQVAAREHATTWPAHPAFGPLTQKDWGRLMYRHMDHHFKQFGV
jgi:hypothetical protein